MLKKSSIDIGLQRSIFALGHGIIWLAGCRICTNACRIGFRPVMVMPPRRCQINTIYVTSTKMTICRVRDNVNTDRIKNLLSVSEERMQLSLMRCTFPFEHADAF